MTSVIFKDDTISERFEEGLTGAQKSFLAADLKKGVAPGVWCDMGICNGCNYCIDFCPKEILDIFDNKGVYQVSLSSSTTIEDCLGNWGCGVCANVCPKRAIIIFKPSEHKVS